MYRSEKWSSSRHLCTYSDHPTPLSHSLCASHSLGLLSLCHPSNAPSSHGVEKKCEDIIQGGVWMRRELNAGTSEADCQHLDDSASKWLAHDNYSCRLIDGHAVFAKEKDLSHVYVSSSSGQKVRQPTRHHQLYHFHVDDPDDQLQLWEATISLEPGLQPIHSKQLMWSRNIGNIERIASPRVRCQGTESLISRKDGSILRSLCLDGFVTAIARTSPQTLNILLLSMSEGSILHVQRLPEGVKKVDHLLIDNNKVIFLYENTVARRTELSLIEFYTEHHSINRLMALANRAGLGGSSDSKNSEDEEIHDGDIKVFHETFALDVPSSKIASIAITQTAQRVTPQSLVLAIPEAEKLYLIPPKFLTARRPLPPSLMEHVSEGVTPGGLQDIDALPYDAYIPLQPWRFIPEPLIGQSNLTISCKPGSLESMTMVTFPNTEVDPIPYYPALKYDSLSDDYSRIATAGTLLTLFVFVFYSFQKLFMSKSSGLWK